jgi:hypothetical protein
MNNQFETPFFSQVITESCESSVFDLFQKDLYVKFFAAFLIAKISFSSENNIVAKLHGSDDGIEFFEINDFELLIDSPEKCGLQKIETVFSRRFLKVVFQVNGTVSARVAVSFQKN